MNYGFFMFYLIIAFLLGVGSAGASGAAQVSKDREAASRLSLLLLVLLGGWTAVNCFRVIPSAASAAPSTFGVIHSESMKSTGPVFKWPWQKLESASLAPIIVIRNKANNNSASTLVAGNRLEVDAQCQASLNGAFVGQLLAKRVAYEQVINTACGSALRKAGVALTESGEPIASTGKGAPAALTLEEVLGPKRWVLEQNATRAFARSLREQLAASGVDPKAIQGALIQIRDTEVDPAVAKAIADRQRLAEEVKGSESLRQIALNKAAADAQQAGAVRTFIANLRGVPPEQLGSISTDEALGVLSQLSNAKIADKGNVTWGAVGVPGLGLSVTPPTR